MNEPEMVPVFDNEDTAMAHALEINAGEIANYKVACKFILKRIDWVYCNKSTLQDNMRMMKIARPVLYWNEHEEVSTIRYICIDLDE